MKYILLALMVLGSVSISGCNTVEGFGEDLRAGGRKLEEAAQ